MNAGHVYAERARAGGAALADYLSARHAHTPRAEWARRAAEGLVLVDGAPAEADAVLRRGQRIEWRRPPWEEPPAPLSAPLLHTDAHVAAFDKPAGLPTLPGAGFLEHTLWALARRRFPTAAPAHRLGRWTSGVVLCALTPAAARALERAWRGGRVEKTYLALAAGEPARDAFDVDVPIGPVPHPRLGTVHAASPAGKRALSRVRVLERRGGESLVEVVIATGRPHQIRVHLAAAGHPLVGDPLYEAGGAPRPDAVPGDGGYHLHALRLRTEHPCGGGTLDILSPPPQVMTPVSAVPVRAGPQ